MEQYLDYNLEDNRAQRGLSPRFQPHQRIVLDHQRIGTLQHHSLRQALGHGDDARINNDLPTVVTSNWTEREFAFYHSRIPAA